MKKIPVSNPIVGFSELLNLFNAIVRKEISGYSKQYNPKFEKLIATACNTKYALTVNSGTSALHLAYVGLGLKAGDKVAIATYTNMATFFPALQLGLIPIPVDVESDSFNIDSQDLEEVMQEGVSAIVVVHIMGQPANMGKIMEISKKYGVPVIEDCAEAFGASYDGKPIGSFGAIGCHSFYANKIITTGEGGAVTTNSIELFERMKDFRSLSFGNVNKFLHKNDGYNFRMSNLQSAFGVAQIKRLPLIIRKKIRIASYYSKCLKFDTRIVLPISNNGFVQVYWMYQIKLRGASESQRDEVIAKLQSAGIESRQGFIPYSDQIHVLKEWGNIGVRSTPTASKLAQESLYLPSGPKLSRRKIRFVCRKLISILDEIGL